MPSVDAMVLGVDESEESNIAKVDEDSTDLEGHPANIEGSVVVYQDREIKQDLMLLDDSPGNVTRNQVNEGSEKGVCNRNEFALESSNKHVKTVQGSYPAEIQRKRKGEKDGHKEVKALLKRKRVSVDCNVNYDSLEVLKAECQQELQELFEYHKEVSGLKLQPEDGACNSNNMMIAFFLEESPLSFSKLVDKIFENSKGRDGITLASVRGAVLFVGQRNMYGVSSADADVLEDDSESCLWCWETRDLKLFPVTLRGIINIRRMARKKIHERISALSDTISALASPGYKDDYPSVLMKSSTKLGKTLNRQGISSFVEKLIQKNCGSMAEKGARLQEKESAKEIEKNKRCAEKEKKKMERELQKEKFRSERELKKIQEEAEREEKRREKEEAELKKQIKKQQEEAAKEQKRREKEQAEQKKQVAIKKQASMMERFLKSKKSFDNSNAKLSPMKNPSFETVSKSVGVVDCVISAMDCAFSQQCSLTIDNLRRMHISSWHEMAKCNRSSRWGVRQRPKIELIKEIKLQRSPLVAEAPEENFKGTSCAMKYISESGGDKLEDVLESFADNMAISNDLKITSSSVRLLKKKLLQFDKSPRPAYYGTCRRKSAVVGPKHPFRKDHELDYEVDSEDEWEEEDPGESLSDCDKDNDESLEAEGVKNDDTESEDSFVVPDGYLSENEGVQIEISSKPPEEDAKSSINMSEDDKEYRPLLQQHKILCNLTEKALRKSQPFILSNLNHEKVKLLNAEDLVGSAKVEQICLQALCMQPCPGGSAIEVLTNSNCEVQQVCHSKETTQAATATMISNMDLTELVRFIQSCPCGMNKMVEMLQQKFPAISKSQLRNKIREISDFVDNRWQVKKDILEKLGLSASQPSTGSSDKGDALTGIAVYFSKRCLPPEGSASINITKSSPSSCLKLKARNLGSNGHCLENDL